MIQRDISSPGLVEIVSEALNVISERGWGPWTGSTGFVALSLLNDIKSNGVYVFRYNGPGAHVDASGAFHWHNVHEMRVTSAEDFLEQARQLEDIVSRN